MELDALVERVLFVLSECRSDAGEDLCQLDTNLMTMKSCSLQVRSLITRHIEDDTTSSVAFQNLLELHNLLDQLCIEYETKLLRRMFIYQSQRGRPKKIINLALVLTLFD